MIDKSGTWWKGESFDDLREYLTLYTAENYPAGSIVQSTCGCTGTTFAVRFDADEGCAQRSCSACGVAAFIGDSDEFWEDADPADAQCPCGNETFEVGVAFSFRDDGDVKWITIGARCDRCGVLGAYADWKIDYSPTDHLLARA